MELFVQEKGTKFWSINVKDQRYIVIFKSLGLAMVVLCMQTSPKIAIFRGCCELASNPCSTSHKREPFLVIACKILSFFPLGA